MKKLGFVMSLALCLAFVSNAQKPSVITDNQPGWRKIGETTASFKQQNESIVVLGADEFSAIKLKVTEGPLEIERLQVFYESGQMEEVDINNRLQPGAETRMINLKHGDRDISKIAFTYKTLPNAKGDKAQVELMGYKNDNQDSEAYRKADEAERDVEDAADDAERAAENTGDDVDRAAENTSEDIEREAREAKRDAKREAREAEREMEQNSEEADKTISETAGNIGAGIKDKIYKNKMGPDGQTIYIDKNSKYYYINADGKKIFITKNQLKDKVDN